MSKITLKNIKIIGIDFRYRKILLEADDKMKKEFEGTNLIKKNIANGVEYVFVTFKASDFLDEKLGFLVNGDDLIVDIYFPSFNREESETKICKLYYVRPVYDSQFDNLHEYINDNCGEYIAEMLKELKEKLSEKGESNHVQQSDKQNLS